MWPILFHQLIISIIIKDADRTTYVGRPLCIARVLYF